MVKSYSQKYQIPVNFDRRCTCSDTDLEIRLFEHFLVMFLRHSFLVLIVQSSDVTRRVPGTSSLSHQVGAVV